MRAIFDDIIVPLYHSEILVEYNEVLHRDKFHFEEKSIQMVLTAIKKFGIEVFHSLQEKFWLIWMI